MTRPFETDTLTDHLQERIAGRRVKTAVFTTFSFEPGFFELQVLPILFDRKFSHVDKIRRAFLEEELRRCGPVAVYYDRRGIVAGSASAHLDAHRVPVARKGFFHPKLALLLLEASEDDGSPQTLLVAVLSANLTEAGWWRNLECAHVEELTEGEKTPLRQDLVGLAAALRREDRSGVAHEALSDIQAFLGKPGKAKLHSTSKGRLRPRLFYGQRPLPEFLKDLLEPAPGEWNMEVISPYFDANHPSSLQKLQDAVEPRETRIVLPFTRDGKAACSETYFDDLMKLEYKTSWAKLPDRALATAGEGEDHRVIHAKVYRLFHRKRRREVLVVGSANLTEAGHSETSAGNLEAALVIERELAHPGFWLDVSKGRPAAFDAKAGRESAEVQVRDPLPVALRFHWGSCRAEYFWDSEQKPPRNLIWSAKGVEFARVHPVTSGRWTRLEVEPGKSLASALAASTFVEVATVAGGRRWTVLVTEAGMLHKPSLLAGFTPEEILRYWSLLTDDQREALLGRKLDEEERIRRGKGKGGPPEPKGAHPLKPRSLFDGFAGIFHAFTQLERHVRQALEDGDEREAEYRLLGNKYDSLPYLLERLLEEKADPVTSYVTMLSARKTVVMLRKAHPRFFRDAETGPLKALLKRSLELRNRVHHQLGGDARKFLAWFEKYFLAEVARGAP